MDVIKIEPDSDSEEYSATPLSEDLASVKMEEVPVAVIKCEDSVSYISLQSLRSCHGFCFLFMSPFKFCMVLNSAVG